MTRELATAAHDLGYAVTVVAPDYLDPVSCQQDTTWPFSVTRYRAGPYSGRWFPSYLRAAIAAARSTKSGRLVAVDGPFLEALALTRPLHSKRFRGIVCGSEILRATGTLRGKIFGQKRIFLAPEKIIAITRFTRDLLVERMPFVKRDDVAVAPLGVNPKWFLPPDPTILKNRLDVVGRRIIVCTGRITPRKGQLTLLRAIQSAAFPAHMRSSLTIVIAGRATQRDREYLHALREASARLAPVRVLIVPDLEDEALRALYAVADIFCLPGSAQTSAIEGFGLVLIEAAAQGLAAVAGNVGGVPEAVLDGHTGTLVPPDDPTALARALAEQLDNTVGRSNFGEAARQHARTFTWERFARAVLEEA